MTFNIDKDDEKIINEWIKKQKEINPTTFTLGERWSYIFTPTGLGMLISIKDNRLDTEKIITNTAKW